MSLSIHILDKSCKWIKFKAVKQVNHDPLAFGHRYPGLTCMPLGSISVELVLVLGYGTGNTTQCSEKGHKSDGMF